jgi:hypothetical protein
VGQHTIGKDSSFDLQRTTSYTTNQAINDDTFDMTFDYDDQDGAQLPPVVAPESELPSPPPPPRQLAQLSDSMKDLSGRLSSCSQKATGLNGVSQEPLNVCQDDDDGHLVDKLISSINLINNVSDDIDSPTTASTSNNDEEYQHFKAMAQSLNSGPTMPLPQSRSYPVEMHSMQRQAADAHQQASNQKCTCNQPILNELGMANELQNMNHLGQCVANSGKAQYNYRGNQSPLNVNASIQQQQRQFACGQPQQKQVPNQQSRIKSDTQAGTNIPRERPSELLISLRLPYDQMPDHVRAAIRSILFIADTIKNEDDENSAIEDWESMSMVVDRLFLWIFFLLCTFGSLIILALAPSLYDQRDSIDDKLRIEIPSSNCSAFKP